MMRRRGIIPSRANMTHAPKENAHVAAPNQMATGTPISRKWGERARGNRDQYS